MFVTVRRYPSRHFSNKKESPAFNLAKSEVQKVVIQNKPVKEESFERYDPWRGKYFESKNCCNKWQDNCHNLNRRFIKHKEWKLQAFISILFAIPFFDRKNELVSLIPSIITDEIKEIITSSSSTSEQARELSDSIETLADDVSRERCYLSRAAKFPFLSTTLITYILQAHYHSRPMDSNLESLK